jgi:hypothetical protein
MYTSSSSTDCKEETEPHLPPRVTGHTHERWIFDTGAMTHVTNNNRYMYNTRPTDSVITVADGTEYAVQCEGELILKSICGAVLTLKSVLYVPEAKNVLSGSRLVLVQGKGHRVEIETVGTRLVCNTGTRSTLHVSYDNENELWYFIGSRLKVPAEINAVASKSKTITASGNSKNKVVTNSKAEFFSGYLMEYKLSAKEDSTLTLQKVTKKL